ncbi:MAG TPA: hypothetical protein VGR70_04675 [Stellaceae bacterium]|nr:hypothetical protein [Stellaceae bacterium]
MAVTVKAEEGGFRGTSDLAECLIDHIETLEQAIAVCQARVAQDVSGIKRVQRGNAYPWRRVAREFKEDLGDHKVTADYGEDMQSLFRGAGCECSGSHLRGVMAWPFSSSQRLCDFLHRPPSHFGRSEAQLLCGEGKARHRAPPFAQHYGGMTGPP